MSKTKVCIGSRYTRSHVYRRDEIHYEEINSPLPGKYEDMLQKALLAPPPSKNVLVRFFR